MGDAMKGAVRKLPAWMTFDFSWLHLPGDQRRGKLGYLKRGCQVNGSHIL